MKVELYKILVELEQKDQNAESALMEILENLKDIDKSDPKVYEGSEIHNCKFGLYEVFWNSGGSSVASVGGLHNGDRYFYPSNWTAEEGRAPGSTFKKYEHDIKKIVLLYKQRDTDI